MINELGERAFTHGCPAELAFDAVEEAKLHVERRGEGRGEDGLGKGGLRPVRPADVRGVDPDGSADGEPCESDRRGPDHEAH